MRGTKVVAACIFNKLQAAGLFLALEGTSMRTDPSTSGRKYRKSVNNAIFFRNEILFVVLAAATSTSVGYTKYRIRENISRVALWEIWLACILGI